MPVMERDGALALAVNGLARPTGSDHPTRAM